MADEPNGTPAGATRQESEPDGASQYDDLSPEEMRAKLLEADAAFARLKGEHGSTNSKLDRVAEELVELRGRLAEQRDSAASRQPANEPEPDDWALTDEDREELDNSPSKVFERAKLATERTIGKFAKQIVAVLDQRDLTQAERYEELTKLIKGNDPKRQAFAGVLEELRKDPRFKDLEDETLIAIAEKTDMAPTHEWPGAPGAAGGARAAAATTKPKINVAEARKGFESIHGPGKAAEEALAKYLKKNGVKV